MRRLVLTAVAIMTLAAPAQASHPRPLSASPIVVSFVPAYEQCVAPDRTHGPPLVFGSCSSPNQASSYLTVGTFDANGNDAKSVGSLRWKARGGQPAPPDDEIVTFTVSFTDVRCQGSTGACAAPGADYAGSLEIRIPVQITDHYNGTGTLSDSEPGTMRREFTPSIPVPCAQTADASIGATCSVNNLYLDAVYPSDPIKEAKRSLWEAGQLQVFDGGSDGNGSTIADNTLFAVQGLFVP